MIFIAKDRDILSHSTTQKASIDGMVSHLNSTPLDPDADVIIGVPAVYLDYVQGRLPKGFSMAAQV